MTTPRLESPPFPTLPLPLPMPFPPLEASRAEILPEGPHWQFEPKWDGFRCLAFRWQNQVILQSKAGQPLTRYFPELVAAFAHVDSDGFVLDGEIVVSKHGTASFDDLLLRIHPAPSRIAKLAQQTPAKFLAFDLLYHVKAGDRLLANEPLTVRRMALEGFSMVFPPVLSSNYPLPPKIVPLPSNGSRI